MGLATVFSKNESLKDFIRTIEGSTLEIQMVTKPSGSFTMGSPASEKHRNLDKGPVHEEALNSFWISKHEITREVYNLFVNRAIDGNDHPNIATEVNIDIDAIFGTIPYVDMSLAMSTSEGLPVGNVTHYEVSQFCQWLSAKRGKFYRLPTEAEWEHADRADTSTAYHFEDGAKKLEDHAGSYENNEAPFHPTGQKKLNPCWLYDMYGKVAEWTVDQYLPDVYQTRKQITISSILFSDKTYPRSIRGGSYHDNAEYIRSATRLGSTKNGEIRDPQFPKKQMVEDRYPLCRISYSS
ncbi:formylglycine-generating enzyme family protein [Maribacter sp. X9]|uniref:formylglycine-generating enzyme family protein n=1 Tax=Maribacter sp. X9 TaxID=3402159 RepID=UPI003AF3DB53